MRLLTPVVLAILSLVVSACGFEERERTREIAPRGGETDVVAFWDECPPDLPRLWADCPEAAWVQRVAERAGYRITGETGSALIARGKGHGFYIWGFEAAKDEIQKVAKREQWVPRAVVKGVVVYGDERSWRWWVVDGFIIWLHAGPSEDSTLPSLENMGALVEASTTLPQP
jgi:hypothetical protein